MATKFPLFAIFSAVDEVTGPVGRMGRSVYGFGEKLKRAGTQLSVGLTLPTLALGAAAVRTSLDYGRSMNAVAARTGASAAELAQLRAIAEDTLGRTGIPATAREAAAGMAELAQSGLDVVGIQTVMPGVLRLSAAAQIDQARAAKLSADVLDFYGLEAQDAARVTDVLALTAVRGQQGIEGLEGSVGALGATARGLGQPLTTNLALLDQLADVGFEGSAGAAALRGALTALARPGAVAQSILERLGVRPEQIKDGEGKVRDLADVLALLEERGITASQVVGLLGKRAGPAFAALLGGGIQRARAFREQLDDAGGSAQKFADVMLGEGVGAVAGFSAQWERFLVTVGRSGILPFFGDLLVKGAGVLRWLSELSPGVLRATVVVAGLGAALGPLLVGLGSTIKGLVLLAPAAKAVGLAVVGVTAPAWGLVGAVLAIGAAAGALFVHWDILQTKTRDTWNGIKASVGGAVDWLGAKLEGLSDFVPDWLAGLFGDDAAAPAIAPARAARPRATLGDGVDRALERSAGGRAGGATVGGRVEVSFANLPRGARVASSSSGDVPLDVDAGYTLAGGLSG